jgi:hypothetical protein
MQPTDIPPPPKIDVILAWSSFGSAVVAALLGFISLFSGGEQLPKVLAVSAAGCMAIGICLAIALLVIGLLRSQQRE